jgi:hypothetical protein
MRRIKSSSVCKCTNNVAATLLQEGIAPIEPANDWQMKSSWRHKLRQKSRKFFPDMTLEKADRFN